ncbi:MAG TPA: MBL fold metallo-hydrolase [Thermomicrobiales bacterium]|nr:MBL fold metallo-hydrolase [Thermomicrobiales bacterium]
MPQQRTEYLSTRRIGNAEVTLILEGSGPYPVELNVAEGDWRPAVPEADADGNVMLCSGGAYVRIGDASVVIDPGLDDPGTATSAATELVFRGWSFTPGFQAALDELGVDNDAVTHVIITHAHFDHCLGVAVERDGRLVPRYPNARYLLDRADWDLHFTPEGEQRPLAASPFIEVNRALRDRLQVIMRTGLFDLLDGEAEVVPGLTTIPTPGETPGHRAVRIESNGAICWHLGDIAHYAVEFEHLDWLTPTRRDAAAMTASRQRILPRIVAEDALVTWSHARFPGWGRIVAVDGGYRWQPEFS